MKPLTRYQRLKRERLRPKPEDAPPGYMYEGRSLVLIAEIERWSRRQMARYDALPRKVRDAYKEGMMP